MGNLPDLTDGVATLVPPGDPAALATAVETAIGDPVQNARMRHAGIARAADYTWARTAESTADVYRKVALDSGSATRP